MRLQRIAEPLKVAGLVLWVGGVGVGVLLIRGQASALREILVASFALPILVATFWYRRLGGLLVALVASLLSGSLAIGEPAILQFPMTQRLLFQIALFNVVALVTSALAEGEKRARLRYQELFTSVPIGLYRKTLSGRVLESNPALVRILGYPDRETLLQAEPAYIHLYAEARRRWEEMIATAGVVRDFEAQVRRYDGTTIWVRENCRGVRDEQGALLYCEGSLEEISARVQAEEKLAAIYLLGREMVLRPDARHIADATVEAAYYVLGFGRCTLWLADPETLALTCQALAADTLTSLGTTPAGAVEPAVASEVACSGEVAYLPEVLPAGEEGSGPHSRLCVPLKVRGQVIGVLDAEKAGRDAFTPADRRLFQTLADVTAVALENARLHGRLAEQADHLESEVARRTAELEEANRELDSFAYSISHDLRAPLRAMDGFSRILQEEHAASVSEEMARYLTMIRENSRRMGRLIDDLLRFSRLSRQPLHKERVDMERLVRDLLRELAPEQAGRPVEVTVGDLPPAQADPALLRQVLFNLLSNALKFTRSRFPAQIEIGYRQDSPYGPAYFIRDNGVGFDMRYADKIFGVFQRLHGEEFEGTGVGLAIVQRIVRRHGGEVWVQAQPDAGATFFFTLKEGKSDVSETGSPAG